MSSLYDIDVSPETPELLEIARVQLRETPEIREASFKELRELLKQNPDLHYGDDEAFMTIVLRSCHWYPESAIKLVSTKPLIAGNESENIEVRGLVELFFVCKTTSKVHDYQ